jgi:recombinational DNA repair ATPase RecF
MTPAERKLYVDALNKWTMHAQLGMVNEEFAELIVAVNQWRRDRVNRLAVLSEIADVSIMLDQLLIMTEFTQEEFETVRREKLNRLADRLGVDFKAADVEVLATDLITGEPVSGSKTGKWVKI